MSTIPSVKQRCDDGESVARIAREEGVSEPTVRKYRDMDDFSPRLRVKKKRGSKPDPFKPVIDAWLAEDGRRRPKRRHTARRAFDRPVAECGYDGGYTIVRKCVKERKAEAGNAKGEFLNLEWAPGEARVDFGVLGAVREVHCLAATFPFSNVSLAQCLWGETPECVCEGLKAVFEFCGGVPARIAFDNATGAGGRVGERIGTADAFMRFAAHYGFSFSFRNPNSGREKGAVGNAVGAIRRNPFVPMPRVGSLVAHNGRILGRCMQRADEDRHPKSEPERQLFVEDRAAMSELPAKPFRVAKTESAKTDKHGDACPEGRRRHPLGPEHGQERVTVEPGAFHVGSCDREGTHIATFGRAYGDAPTKAGGPTSQPALPCGRPGGRQNGSTRAALPAPLSEAMDSMARADRNAMLRMLRDVGAASGFDAAVRAMAAPGAGGTVPSEADVALAAACIANGQGAISYDDAPDPGMCDAAFAKGA